MPDSRFDLLSLQSADNQTSLVYSFKYWDSSITIVIYNHNVILHADHIFIWDKSESFMSSIDAIQMWHRAFLLQPLKSGLYLQRNKVNQKWWQVYCHSILSSTWRYLFYVYQNGCCPIQRLLHGMNMWKKHHNISCEAISVLSLA